MGQEQAKKVDPSALKTSLREARARMAARKSQRENGINKTKKEVLAHIKDGEEALALINVESLINDERMVPCIEILTMMCKNVEERVSQLMKMGKEVPADLATTFHTILYSAPKINVAELSKVADIIGRMYGPKFCKETNESKIDETIRDNINIISPEIGAKIDRLMKLAQAEGITFEPSEKHKQDYQKYKANQGGVVNLDASKIVVPGQPPSSQGPPQGPPQMPYPPGAYPGPPGYMQPPYYPQAPPPNYPPLGPSYPTQNAYGPPGQPPLPAYPQAPPPQTGYGQYPSPTPYQQPCPPPSYPQPGPPPPPSYQQPSQHNTTQPTTYGQGLPPNYGTAPPTQKKEEKFDELEDLATKLENLKKM